MNEQGERILGHLRAVAAERATRSNDAGLGARAQAIKQYQHDRFRKTYADLLAQQRYARAAEFFLQDLYGPYDFSLRDAQFARVVPGLVRLFPGEIVETVEKLGELHSLSETLDSAMARQLSDPRVDAERYVVCWQLVGREADRLRQVHLMRAVGDALDRYTRTPLLRQTLHLMHRPAHLLGLGALQDFLENGFDTFRDMRGASEFLDTIERRETSLAHRLFEANVASLDSSLFGELP